jgi:hypothetical protein
MRSEHIDGLEIFVRVERAHHVVAVGFSRKNHILCKLLAATWIALAVASGDEIDS